MVRSNSLPEGTLLRYQNNNLVQIVIGLQANLDQAAAATPSSTSGSTLLQNSAEERDSQDTTVATDDEQLPDQYHSSETLSVSQSLRMQQDAPTDEISSLPEAVASLHAAIQKIKINERDMKTLLLQHKKVLESKLSVIDQRLEKADNITSHNDSVTQSLVQLQTTYSWLQVKLQTPPNDPVGACSLCQRHSTQIRQHRGYSAMQNWLDCSVLLDSNHRAHKVLQHEQSDCHKLCKSAEEQRKKNAILFSSQVSQRKESEVTERFLLRCYGLLQCHVPYNRYPFMTYLHHLQGVDVGNRHLTDMAMASATDCIYNVQLRSLVKFINSPNPATGRLRHCHLSFDKVTVEHVTRQVVNLRILDLNGEPVCINGNQWRSQEKIKVPPCRAEGATHLGGSGGILPRENFET